MLVFFVRFIRLIDCPLNLSLSIVSFMDSIKVRMKPATRSMNTHVLLGQIYLTATNRGWGSIIYPTPLTAIGTDLKRPFN
jgi:hypothetical protein